MDDRQRIVTIMQNWVGAQQGDVKHQQIVDTFNSIGVGKISKSKPWCAATTSAAYKICGLSNLFPSSASCEQQIDKAKKMGIWVEDDAYVPSPGDSIIYAWKDPNPKGDNTTGHDHTGIIEKVVGGTMTIIEGNMVSKGTHYCGRRTLSVNGKNIRGFVTPNFGTESKPETKLNTDVSTYPTINRGDKGAWVTLMQNLLIARGYSVGKEGPDGDFGKNTEEGLMVFQADKGLQVDGICGYKTWNALTK